MTADDLRGWQRRCGIKNDQVAADMLGVSVSSFRRWRKGTTRVPRTISILTSCIEIRDAPILKLAEAVMDAWQRLGHLTPYPLLPSVAETVVETLTKVGAVKQE